MSFQPPWLGLSFRERGQLCILPSDGWEGALKIPMCSVKSGMGGLRNEVDDVAGDKVLGTAPKHMVATMTTVT